jgi:hypothetical protein
LAALAGLRAAVNGFVAPGWEGRLRVLFFVVVAPGASVITNVLAWQSIAAGKHARAIKFALPSLLVFAALAIAGCVSFALSVT